MSTVVVESPYRGLRPFEDSRTDALLFFGRELETELIAANLLAARLTVLYGPSGVGKSSVLRAGVMHRLRAEGDLIVRFESWSGDPVAGIADAVRKEVSERLGEEVEDEGGSLATRLHAWRDLLGAEIYLVLDQVEEYFLYHGRNGKPDALMSELPDVVNQPGLRVNVLLGIREDALALLDAFKARIPQVFGNYLRLDRLDRSAGEAAILGPLVAWNELAGEDVAAEPELVEALLDEVSVEGGRVEAPYLQVVLERVWEAERAAGSSLLRRATLARLGGAERIVDEHLELALAGLAADERDTAAEMFAHLVTPGGTKIAHELHDLASYAGRDVKPVAAALVAERILRPVDGGTNGGRVEIYHDVLAGAVAEWRVRHEAERRLEQERRRQRRLAATVGVLVLGLALMTALAAYAFSQRSEAAEKAELAATQRAAALSAAEDARQAQQRAQSALQESKRQEARAEEEAENARQAEDEAQRQTESAQAAQEDAETSAAAESAARQNAEESEHVAQEQTEVAQSALSREQAARAGLAIQRDQAERQKRRAERNELRAEQKAREAKVRELAFAAQAQLDVDPSRSLDLAVQASGLAQGPLVEDALRNALLAIRVRAVLGGGGGALRSARFSGDGRFVVTAAEGGEARVFDGRTGVLLQRFRHGSTVVAVAVFSPDARTVVTGARDGRARVWSVATGALVRPLPHNGPVVDAEFTPDGRILVTASTDKSMRIWDAASGLLLRRLEHPDSLRRVLVSQDGRHAITLTGDRFARAFSLPDGDQVARLEQSGEITGVAFSPVGGLVATTGRRNAFVWDTSTWTSQRALEGHTFVISAAAFSPDGRRLATASADGSGRVWDVARGETIATLLGHRHSLTAAAYHPVGSVLATASRDRTIRIWAGPDGNLAFTFAGHREAVTGVEFSRDGGRLLTRSDDEDARLWETWTEPSLTEIARHGDHVVTTAVSPNGAVVLSAGLDGVARLTPRSGGSPRLLNHGGRLLSAEFSRNGEFVLTAAEDGTAKLWRTSDGALLAAVAHRAPIRAAAIDPSGSTIATAGSDGVLRLWSAGTGRERVARRLAAALTALTVSRDGTLLAVGDSAGVVRLLKVTDGRLVTALEGHTGEITTLAFSRTADRVAAGGESFDAHLWNVADRTSEMLRGHRNALTAVAFSPNAQLVLTTSVDGDARLWNTRTGRFERTLSGHVATISTASFSQDGRWVVTAGPGAAGLWHVRTGGRIFFLRGHDGALRAASFAPDGRALVTGGADGTVRRFRCEHCGDVADLRRRAERRLTALNQASATATRGR